MFRLEILRMAGFTEEEMEKDSLLEVAEEEFRNVVRRRLLDTNSSDNSNQKVIHIDEIEEYVDEGWEYVKTLPNDRVIMRLPS